MKKKKTSDNEKKNKIIDFPRDSDAFDESSKKQSNESQSWDQARGRIVSDGYKWFLSIPQRRRIVLVAFLFLAVIAFAYLKYVSPQQVQVSIQTDSTDEVSTDNSPIADNSEVSEDEQSLIINADETISTITNPEVDNTETPVIPNDKAVSLTWPESSGLELVKTSVLESIDFKDVSHECINGFNSEILTREKDVDLEQKMTRAYIDSIMLANEIFEEYDSTLQYEDKLNICTNAANERDTAKNIYRQEFNEQIIANYYAKCALDSKNDDEIMNQIGFYMKALDYYFGSYAVSCKNNTGYYRTLEYIATCYFNIGACASLDDSMRKDAYLYAISIFEIYLEKGANDKQLVTMFNIGRAYMRLCELENNNPDKNTDRQFFYITNAYYKYADMLKSPYCRSKLRPNVYEELKYLSQFMADNIDSTYYEGMFTKAELMKAHDHYEKHLDYYLNMEH